MPLEARLDTGAEDVSEPRAACLPVPVQFPVLLPSD